MEKLSFIESAKDYTQKISRQHLFVDFSKACDSIHREKMEQTFLTYGFLKEIVTTIKMLCKDTKAIVHLPNGNKDCFNIVAEVLQDTLTQFAFISYLDYVV